MGLISGIEEKIACIVEAPFAHFAKLSPSTIEIAVKRLIEKEKRNVLGVTMVTGAYQVVLDPARYTECEPFIARFTEMITNGLAAWLKDKDYRVIGNIDIRFVEGQPHEGRYEVKAVRSDKKRYCEGVPSGVFEDATTNMMQEDEGEGDKAMERANKEHICDAGTKGCIGILTDKNKGTVYHIMDEGAVLGRRHDCDIIVNDEAVSAMHLILYQQHGKLTLEDCGSANGTRVNRMRTERVILKPGDIIRIGRTEFLYQLPY